MEEEDSDFEAVVLPHLDEAYNLARWLMPSPSDAEDVVQEAILRALTYFASFRGGSARAWLLQIVRNTAYSMLRQRVAPETVPLDGDEAIHADEMAAMLAEAGLSPEALLARVQARRQLDSLLAELPEATDRILESEESPLRCFSPRMDIQQMNHQYVYSRLFRS